MYVGSFDGARESGGEVLMKPTKKRHLLVLQ